MLQANAETAVGYWILRLGKNRENGRTCTGGNLHMLPAVQLRIPNTEAVKIRLSVFLRIFCYDEMCKHPGEAVSSGPLSF